MGKKAIDPFKKIAHDRGRTAEAAIFKAITNCIASGKVPEWVTGYEQATPEDDAHGIDGWFKTDVGKIPLQIKSSKTGKRIFTSLRPQIPTVVIQYGQSDEQILAKCLAAIAPKRKEYLQKRNR